jgi:hypothetical protein
VVQQMVRKYTEKREYDHDQAVQKTNLYIFLDRENDNNNY